MVEGGAVQPGAELREQLERILGSRWFQSSALQSQFLRYTVEKTLNGQASQIKEYVIGSEAFGRGPDFDPRVDSVVRVVARRVRDKLADYYGAEGRDDLILIHLSKGSYVPAFEFRGKAVAAADAEPSSSPETIAPESFEEPELIGARVSHYELLELLGSGGAGAVYRAEDLRLKRGVALKLLHPASTGDPYQRERFEREAQSASAVNHPGFRAIYDVGEYLGRPFVVMELAEGRSLLELIDGKPLPVEITLELGAQISGALAAAHARGVTCRDIRAENIIVNGLGQAKLLELGTAQPVMARAAGAGGGAAAAQTAPDPAFSARADLIGFGALLYRMATGHAPAGAEAPLARFENPAVPAELEALICRALAADPAIESIREAHECLVRLKRAHDLTSSAAEPGKPARAAGRGKWLWLLLPASLLAALDVWIGAPPAPRITRYTQLTNDAQGKLDPVANSIHSVLATDGSRIYFSEVSGTGVRISEVATSGGETVPLSPAPGEPLVALNVSPDGSKLLAASFYHESPDVPLQLLPLPGGVWRPLGNLIGHDGAWSPDGNQIVYANGDALYVASSEGSGSRELARCAGRPSWPRWSPDGSVVRFTVTDLNGGNSLWEVPAAGTGMRALLPGWRNQPEECCGSWSPDGRHFVFQSVRDGITGLWAIEEGRGLFGRASAPVPLTEGPSSVSAPLFSRDGRTIFAVVQQRRGELVRYDSKTRDFNIFLSGISADHVEFSRDARWIAYTAFPEATLWRSRADGRDRLQLSPPSMKAWFPRWSPDGKRIAFTASAQGKPLKIYIVAASGGDSQLQMPGGPTEADPNWSPDGESLMFATSPSATGYGAGRTGIEILDLKTHRRSALPGSEGLSAPRWSPDGRFVIATAISQNQWSVPGVRIFDFHTGRWTGLEDDPIDNKWWSADGKYFYFDRYSHDAPAIFRIRMSDRRIERVASLKDIRRSPGILGWWMGLTPSGDPMVLRDTSIEEIYALDWNAR